MKTRLKWFAVCVASLFIIYIVSLFNTYTTFNQYNLDVKELYSGLSGGKYPRTEFIAVLKTDDGILFDRRISPTLFSQIHKGDKIVLELRPIDIKQTPRDNLIWFFGYIVFVTIFSTIALFSLVFSLSNKIRSWVFENERD